MTQKDKLREAIILAQRVKSTATSIEYEAKDYDEKWPLKHADSLRIAADNFLKLMK